MKDEIGKHSPFFSVILRLKYVLTMEKYRSFLEIQIQIHIHTNSNFEVISLVLSNLQCD